MKYLILCLCIFFSTLSFAQTAGDNMNVANMGGGSGVVRLYDGRYEGVKGTPLAWNTWLQGDILFANKQLLKKVPLKYEAYSFHLVAKRQSGDSVIIGLDEIREVKLDGNRKYIPIMTQEKKLKLFQVFYEGKVKLLQLQEKILVKANFKGAYNTGNKYDEFQEEISWYIQKADGQLQAFKPNAKGFTKVFEDKKEQVKDLIKKEDLSFKENKDLIRIVSFYDNL